VCWWVHGSEGEIGVVAGVSGVHVNEELGWHVADSL